MLGDQDGQDRYNRGIEEMKEKTKKEKLTKDEFEALLKKLYPDNEKIRKESMLFAERGKTGERWDFFERLGYPEKKLHASLIDTDKYKIGMEDFKKIQQIVNQCCSYGTDFIMIGGSKGTIEQVAFCKLAVFPVAMIWSKPVVLFPHNADDIIGWKDKDIQNEILEKLKKEARDEKQIIIHREGEVHK